jgi:signal transduction histidine kinase
VTEAQTRRLDQLKWVAVLAPIFVLLGFEVVRRTLQPSIFAGWPGFVLLAALVALGTLVFAEVIFTAVERVQTRLVQQNRELLALHEAGLAIVGELELEAVLQMVVSEARELVGAQRGTLSLVDEEGAVDAVFASPPELAATSADNLARAQAVPVPLLLVSSTPGKGISRVQLVAQIGSHGREFGTLVVTEKVDAEEFSADDEETLNRFATQAAVAIENARLHGRVAALAITEERARIAREMHDSLAQVLGYVNTKAQAAQALLDQGKNDRASEQIGQLADSARAAYADVREGILGLRTSLGQDRGLIDALREYLDQWQAQSGVQVELKTARSGGFGRSLSPLAEVQLVRIVQEALANVRKHASATRAEVSLMQLPDAIEVIIADNGVGFAPDRLGRTIFPRFGLATMRERALAAGGSFEVDSTPGHGTRLTVRIPTERAPVGVGRMIDAHPHR